MSPKEFNDKYFGPDAAAAPFRSDLTVDWVGDPATVQDKTPVSNGINPQYCATDECAADLSTLLSGLGTVEIYKDFPMPGWPADNQFTQSHQVPFFRVTDNGFSTTENAGQMAAFFSHGYPPDTAAQWMRNQFTMDLKAQQDAAQQASA